jgi:hypothetical protein
VNAVSKYLRKASSATVKAVITVNLSLAVSVPYVLLLPCLKRLVILCLLLGVEPGVIVEDSAEFVASWRFSWGANNCQVGVGVCGVARKYLAGA